MHLGLGLLLGKAWGQLRGGERAKGRRLFAEVRGRAQLLGLWAAKKVAVTGELTQREQEEHGGWDGEAGGCYVNLISMQSQQ